MNKYKGVAMGMVASLLTCYLASSGNAEEKSSEDIATYLYNARRDDRRVKIRSMTPIEKAEVLDTFRNGETWRKAYVSEYLLTHLGDTDERKRAIDKFRRVRWFNFELIDLGEPWVIEELAPEMFRDEEFENILDGDILNYPISYGVAGLIIANLQNATIYSDGVLEWAKRTSPHALPQLRAVMRDWWRENEQFFKEKNYQAVLPGREVPKLETADSVTPVPPRPGENGDSSPANLPPAPPSPTTPEIAHDTDLSNPSKMLFWVSIGAGMVLLAGLLFVWKRRG